MKYIGIPEAMNAKQNKVTLVSWTNGKPNKMAKTNSVNIGMNNGSLKGLDISGFLILKTTRARIAKAIPKVAV